jgi:hypothetical protein
MPLVEQVRQLADENTPSGESLEFYDFAIQLGCTPTQADEIDTALTLRIMRTLGAI